jgi:hypothetical protein
VQLMRHCLDTAATCEAWSRRAFTRV